MLVYIICLTILPAFAYADGESFTITFDTGGYGEVAPVTITPDEQNKTVRKPANPEGNDHCLEYWTKEGSDQAYDFSTPVESSFTLVAHWSDEHSYEDIEIIASSTCTTAGSKKVKCSVCNAEDIIAIEPTGHHILHADEVPSTCTEHGTAAHYYCENEGCGALFEDEEGTKQIEAEELELPLAKHQTELVPGRESSCIVAGNTAYYKCKVCNNLFDNEEGTSPTTEAAHVRDLAAHSLKKVEAREATCIEKGNIAYYQCSVCEKLFSAEDNTEEIDEDSIEVDYQAHDLIHHDAVDATCTTSGNIEYWDCIYCKKYFTDAEGTAESETTLAALIIPNGHILQAVSGTAATCTTDGTKAYWKCSTCNKLFSDAAGTREITAPEKIPASHTLTEVAAKAATCTRDGNRAYWKCSVCGKLFSDAAAGTEIKASETVVPAAHQYKNGVCTVCGTQIENYNKIIKGNGGTAYYGNDYSFTISADYKTVRETLEVKVDGKKIARSSFGLSEGSTIVTLSRDYINTLSAGAYDIEIVTNQGTARGSFRVSTSPKTGDNNDVTLWVTEEIVSLLGMTAITWYLFRRKET